MYSLNEILLHHTFLKLIIEIYLPNLEFIQPNKDPLISPSKASTEVKYYFLKIFI